MSVRTYRAATVQEALQMVRRDLGPEASVLQARELRGSGVWRFLPGRKGFEIVATREVQVPSRMAPREPLVSERTELAASRVIERDDTHEEIKSQIAELQAMVSRLCRQNEQPAEPDLQDGLFRVYTALIEAEVSEPAARQWIDRMRHACSAHELANPELAHARLTQSLVAEIQVTGPTRPRPGRCHVMALVGPTGVGKTTTIAKLAANFRLREKRNVGLITVDTYRIAAVEQLRTYAEIIDLPMEVVSTPREMRAAVDRLSTLDLIIIDTAGRSPSDEVKIQELRAMLAEAKPDEVHLVLSSAASASTLKRTADRFAPAAPTALLFTKLDEALALGNVIESLLHSKVPVSYLTNGQNVPDDIEAADPRLLVQRALSGGDSTEHAASTRGEFRFSRASS